MKVIHVLSTKEFSGAENVVCQIIKMLENRPDIESIYCSPDGPIKDNLAGRGIAFEPISGLTVAEIKRVINKYKPDIIHAHDMRASYVVYRAHGKVPFVSHIHNNAFASRKITPKSIAFILAAMKAKHIFWVSQSALQGYIFKKLVAKKSSLLRNIIDVEALYNKMNLDTDNYNYDVIYLGRLSWEKNPARMIRVFAKVVEKNKSAKLAVVGIGIEQQALIQQCEELGITDRVDFLGFNTNPLKILHDSKLMIMTSLWEGTPMCALEAMALGVPIVSTPTDGLKDLVIEGQTGYLSDDDGVLADSITKLISDEKMRSDFSKLSYEKSVEHNNIEVYRDKIIACYEKCMK